MRFWRFLFLGLVVLLTGCDHIPFHSKSHSYLNESAAIPPTSSAIGASIKPEDQYYPVPKISNMALAKKMPSIIPPGSNLQRFAKKKPVVSATKKVKLTTQSGQTVVVLNEPVDKAWKDVPAALAKTPYHVLDQDRSLSSYFVLDTPETNDQITEKTPIYRLSLSPKDNETVVQLYSRNNRPVSPDVSKRILTSLANRWYS